jgi:hypothetical protein
MSYIASVGGVDSYVSGRDWSFKSEEFVQIKSKALVKSGLF